MNTSVQPSAGPVITGPLIRRGVCYAMFAYDVGLSIDLDRADRLLAAATQRETIKHKRRAPASVIGQPAPVRVSQTIEPLSVGPYHTDRTVETVLYDFGAVSVTYTLGAPRTLNQLRELSDLLYDNEQLVQHAGQHIDRLVSSIRPAVGRGSRTDAFESYVIFQIEAFDDSPNVAVVLEEHAGLIAQILRAEMAPLSAQEVADALASRISYGLDDVAVIDWNATFLVGGNAEDTRTVLEFANVELLEMRFLDQQLDDALDQSYHRVFQKTGRRRLLLGSLRSDLDRVQRLQVDSALFFEGVNNAIKLVGDQFLARIYRMASQRFHLAEWDASILRKLETLESIYTKLSDRQMNRRMEILEWIIILLFIIDIAIPFIPGMKH